MKKLIATVLVLSLLLAALAVPAAAEEADAQSSATSTVTAKGGQHSGKQPGARGPMGGQNAPSQGQAPGRGGKKNTVPQGQAPGNGNLNGQNNGQNGIGNSGQSADESSGQIGSQGQTSFPNQKDQRFMKPGRNRRGGSRAGSGQQNVPADQAQSDASAQSGSQQQPAGIPGAMDLSGLVSQGIIDEETLTKIEEYLKENTPAQPAAPDMIPPENPAENQTTDSAEPPALPDGQAPAADPLSELLSVLVEKGILTQEQADAIISAAAPAETGAVAAPAETTGDGTGV